MKLIFKSNKGFSVELMQEALNHGVFALLEKAGFTAKPFIKRAEMVIEFEVEGQTERVVIVKENKEIFTAVIEVDENGKVINNVDNMDHDIFTELKELNQEIPTEEIVSEYDMADLTVVEDINSIDLRGIRYNFKNDAEHQLLQYFNNGKLVVEVKIKKIGDELND